MKPSILGHSEIIFVNKDYDTHKIRNGQYITIPVEGWYTMKVHGRMERHYFKAGDVIKVPEFIINREIT